jgi:hypothetical protein
MVEWYYETISIAKVVMICEYVLNDWDVLTFLVLVMFCNI